MPDNFLSKILISKRRENEGRKAVLESVKINLDKTTYTRYSLFKKRISLPGKINLIAEIKKASPSRGVIRDDFDPEALARVYDKAGVAAISILTEEKYFQGKPAYLKMASEKFNTPTLMKDFVIDELQLYDARYCGASAALLIMAVLSDDQTRAFLEVSRRLDIDALVEVHDEEELERALHCGAEIIGINNRNLKTFEVDLATSEKLIPRIPADKVIVAESGIKTYQDVCRLKEAGAHAVLIGETFLRERDVARKIKEVMYGES